MTKTIYTATGNTYPAREYLRECGLTWDRDDKVWRGESFDADQWAKYNSASYSRKAVKVCQHVEIETSEVEA